MQQETPILCLASWYPNDLDIFEGDFIQRKMQALSLYKKVEVFHIKKHFEKSFEKSKTEKSSNRLKETVWYHKSQKGILGAIAYYVWMFKAHNKYLKKFTEQHGKPTTVLVQVPYNAGIIAWYWKKKFGIKYILTEHYGIYNNHYENNFSKRSWLYKFIVRHIIDGAAKLITVSHSLAADINNMVVQKAHSKVSNVVDTDIFKYKAKPAQGKFIFSHFSNMIPVKNIPGMLQAAFHLSKKNINFELHLVGSKNAEHIALAQQLNLYNKYVFFKNAIPYQQVANELHKSHALLMFSNTESQSCISLEALCTGTPVISSRAGGIEEHLDDSNSILVARGDEQALAKAMQQMIENYDSYKLTEISEKNRALWNFDKIGKQYAQIIETVLCQ